MARLARLVVSPADTFIYVGLCWVSLGTAILLLTLGLWNATLAPSEKGFHAMSFILSLFAVVAVQNNVRDLPSLRAGAESRAGVMPPRSCRCTS